MLQAATRQKQVPENSKYCSNDDGYDKRNVAEKVSHFSVDSWYAEVIDQVQTQATANIVPLKWLKKRSK